MTEGLTLRPTIEPNSANGLRAPSQAMVDKLMTSRVTRVGAPVGHLSDSDMAEIDRRLAFILGFRDAS